MSATNARAAARAVVRLVCRAWVDDALRLVVFNRWQIFASERESQTCRTLVSFRSPERTFFALKFGELLVDSAHEVFARLIRERNDPFPKCGLPFSGAGFSLWCFHERTPF